MEIGIVQIISLVLGLTFALVPMILHYREARKSERRLRQKILGLEEETLTVELHERPAYDRERPAKIPKPKVERVEVDRLLSILKTASSDIKKLEKEVKVKGKKVKELKELSENLESLVSLREKQVKAVRRELSSILKKDRTSNRIWTIIIGAIWFILGLVVRGFLAF